MKYSEYKILNTFSSIIFYDCPSNRTIGGRRLVNRIACVVNVGAVGPAEHLAARVGNGDVQIARTETRRRRRAAFEQCTSPTHTTALFRKTTVDL